MLLDDRPLIVLPTLAIAIGVNEAIELQQLHWLLCDPKNGKRIAEHQWIFNTVEQWRVSYFPFWSERTIRTIFSNLSRMKLIITCQPDGRLSRRKYYRVNTEKLPELLDAAKYVTSKRQESSLPITETTAETSSKESKETADESAALSVSDYSAVWKPISGTKQEKLNRIRPPRDYPSELEFDEYVENSMLLELGQGKRADLYSTLCDRKWHHWDTVGHKWVPIRSWQNYIQALDEKMSKATAHDFSGKAFRMPHSI
jgi:hypothetical protein